MKKRSIRIAIGLLAAGTMCASAQTAFNDTTGDHLWTNAANWSAGLPDAADAATQTSATTLNLNADAGTVASFMNGNNATSTFNIVSGGALTTSGRFDIGNSGGTGVGILNVDGGTLTANGVLQLGRFGTRTGYLNLNSGSIHANAETQIGGWNAGVGHMTINDGTYMANAGMRVGISGDGTLTMNGGMLNMTNEWGPGTLGIGNSAGSGLFVLNGGDVSVSQFTLNSDGVGTARAEINGGLLHIRTQWNDGTFNVANAGAELFIGEGVLTRTSDSMALFTNAIESGFVTWDSSSTTMLTENWDVSYTNGTGSILYVDYNDAISGQTTMWAVIPEPATLGLVAAMGGAMLMIRRTFKM